MRRGFNKFDYKPVTGIPTPTNPGRIGCNGRTKAGADEAVLECAVLINAVGGTYQASAWFRLGPIPGSSRERGFKITVPYIEVVPVRDTNVYPKSAVATVSLDQQQVLTSGAAKIEVLLDQLNIRVDRSGAETADLRVYLSNLTKEGQSELKKGRKAYNAELSSGAKEPIFFEDLSSRLLKKPELTTAGRGAHLLKNDGRGDLKRTGLARGPRQAGR